MTEVAYLLARDIGNDAAADFVSSLAATELVLEAPLAEDYVRSAETLRPYADANLDFVDALIAATAERLNIRRLLTLDRLDSQLIRPKHIVTALNCCYKTRSSSCSARSLAIKLASWPVPVLSHTGR